jgi:hypothetical protein
LETCDVKFPHKKPFFQRRKERLDWERKHFDEDYYMQDVMETGVISAVISLKTWWEDMFDQFHGCASDEDKQKIGWSRIQRSSLLRSASLILILCDDQKST